jgi:hypothetical protein
MVLFLLVSITLDVRAGENEITISRQQLLNKVRGGWAGQMIGVSLGAPAEFMASDAPYVAPLAWDQPSSVSNALNQDDLYVEMTFAKVMDDMGLDAPAEAYARAFGDSKYGLWHANYYARKNIRAGIMPPASGHPEFNPHADDIDFQIEADFIGLMCPGMPRLSNQFCDRIGHIMNYGDGVYGGMFVSAMYAAAFFERDPEKLVQVGLAAIPKESDYAMAIRAMIKLHNLWPYDWRKAWNEFYRVYFNTDTCSELVLHRVDIDAKVNGALIVLGMLYGDGDFNKTVSIAIAGGQDADCNGASAAGIWGAMYGYDALPAPWIRELDKIRKQKFAFTDYSFDDICASTIRRIEKAVVMTGGHVEGDKFVIPQQTPQAPELETWHTGRPAFFARHDLTMLKWIGAWEAEKTCRTTTTPGDRVVLIFEGSGFIAHLLGGEAQGIADILVDGKSIGSFDAYRPYKLAEAQYFYRTLGSDVKRHTLEIVNSGRKNQKSSGTNLGVVGVQVFGGKF